MEPLPNYVVGYVIDPPGQRVVLLHKNRPEYLAGMWMGPGGKVEPGETPLQAMRREFQEEVGVAIEDWTFIKVLERPSTPCHLSVFFACHDLSNIKTMTDEEVRVFSFDELEGLSFANSFLEIREQLATWAALKRSETNTLAYWSDTLNALVERGPLWDGDIPSKSQRDELLTSGHAVRVIVKGQDGYTAATYQGAEAYRCFHKGETLAHAIANRHAHSALARARPV